MPKERTIDWENAEDYPESTDRVQGRRTYCYQHSVKGLICTRIVGHPGPHAAHMYGNLIHVWDYVSDDPDLTIDEGL